MSTFTVDLPVGDLIGQRWESVEALVDTGSTNSWVPRDILVRLGIQPREVREYETADGRVIARDLGVANARLDGRELPTPVAPASGLRRHPSTSLREELGFQSAQP